MVSLKGAKGWGAWPRDKPGGGGQGAVGRAPRKGGGGGDRGVGDREDAGRLRVVEGTREMPELVREDPEERRRAESARARQRGAVQDDVGLGHGAEVGFEGDVAEEPEDAGVARDLAVAVEGDGVLE